MLAFELRIQWPRWILQAKTGSFSLSLRGTTFVINFCNIDLTDVFRTKQRSYRVRGVGGSFALHLTVESYTIIIISVQSYFYYWYSITHSLFYSRLKSVLFCESSLPQPFLCLLQDSLYGFPRLFTATSEHIRLFTF